MRLFLLLSLSLLCFAAETFPPEVLAAEEKNEKAAKDIKADADAKLAKANADLLKVYNKAVEAATRKGDLKLALALQGKAEKLDEATDLLAPPKPESLAEEALAKLPNLTQAEWDKLPGEMVQVPINETVSPRSQPNAGERWGIIPCPQDAWKTDAGPSVDYRGLASKPNWAGTSFNAYALYWQVGNGPRSNSLTATGVSGKLMLGSNIVAAQPNRSGIIRVKVIKL